MDRVFAGSCHLPVEMACDFLAIQLDSAKTAGKAITILDVDGGEKLALVLRNSVLNHLAKPAANPDLSAAPAQGLSLR